jgi:hypothetical protein
MSTGSTQPFRPAGTAALAASTSSANVALKGGGTTVLVYNSSAATAFFQLGAASGLSASQASTPVPAGARMLVEAGPFVTYAAAILAAGTGTVYFTIGDGDTY